MAVEAVIATQVIDTTVIGRGLMTAVDAAAVRSLVDVSSTAETTAEIAAAVADYLPLAGGTLSGGLTVEGSLAASALTQGSILFAGASGVLSQDNSNLFWNDTNNRLGIGTASPGVKLHIVDTLTNSLTIESSANTGTSVAFKNTSTGGADWRFFSLGSMNSAGTGNFVINEWGVADRFIIKKTTGWVGINKITSLGGQLHVVPNAATTIGQIIQGTSSQTANLTEWHNSAGTVGASISAAFAATFGGPVRPGVYTVATLPSAVANAGATAYVTDSSVTTFGDTAVGGGANNVEVRSNGSNWTVSGI